MHFINGKWDMIIAFPPCTYLTVTGNRWFNVERYGEKAVQRHMDTTKLPPDERAKARSKTWPGTAKAMAEQWGGTKEDT